MSPDQIRLADAVAAQLGLQPAPGSDGHWSRVFPCLMEAGSMSPVVGSAGS